MLLECEVLLLFFVIPKNEESSSFGLLVGQKVDVTLGCGK